LEASIRNSGTPDIALDENEELMDHFVNMWEIDASDPGQAPARPGEDSSQPLVRWGGWSWGEHVGDFSRDGAAAASSSPALTLSEVRVLETLLTLTSERCSAWQELVRTTRDETLRHSFVTFASVRDGCAIELQRLLCTADPSHLDLGGTESPASRAGTRARRFFAATILIEALAQAEQADANLVVQYTSALNQVTHPGARAVLRHQLARSERMHSELVRLLAGQSRV
jgi:hypothetical protein